MKEFDEITQTISTFDPITLEEMKAVRMMNRTDTKYVVPIRSLVELLKLAVQDYRIQEVDGERNIAYHTVYYDTPDQKMYIAHQNGKKTREKIRLRTYVSSGLSFFEIKNKNNKGRTDKKRIQIEEEKDFLLQPETQKFLSKHAMYSPEELSAQLENFFKRITLVNRGMTERLTIDTDLRFRNLLNDRKSALPGVAIIELKRNGRTPSPMYAQLIRMHIHTSGFSKYCMGYALTDPKLKQNRFKERVRWVTKINAQADEDQPET